MLSFGPEQGSNDAVFMPKAFQAIGAKARLSLHADVGAREDSERLNMRT